MGIRHCKMLARNRIKNAPDEGIDAFVADEFMEWL